MADQTQSETRGTVPDTPVPPAATAGILDAFEKHLSSRKLIPDNQLRYYAKWVGEFLRVCGGAEKASYTPWVLRFQEFVDHDGPGDSTAQDAKDFLTHLALRERVSASSQNQAFNALLSRDGLN